MPLYKDTHVTFVLFDPLTLLGVLLRLVFLLHIRLPASL
jgi:hypothetical protein